MEQMTHFVGDRIRFFRKLKGWTMQELADAIGKSKSTVSKYEKGEIAIDVDVLHEISKVLEVSMVQFVDCPDHLPERAHSVVHSAFSEADTLFLYTSDSHTGQMVESAIRVHQLEKGTEAVLYFGIPAKGEDYHECRSYYQGTVKYHSAIINFVLNNQFNEVEQMFIALYNPLVRENATPGILCGLTHQGIQPVALRCIVSLRRLKMDENLHEQLYFTRNEQLTLKKMNALIIENQLGDL